MSNKYETPAQRLNAPLSIIKGIKNNKILETISIENLLTRIGSGENDLTRRLRNYKLRNEALYQTVKAWDCYGFVVGKWEKRSDDKNIKYVPLVAIDIDYLDLKADGSMSQEAHRLFLEIQMSEFTFACYPSLGGGLRVLVWTESLRIENHKEVYQQVVQHFCDYLKLPIANSKNKTTGIDGSCSNPSRAWFYTSVNPEWLYVETNASSFPYTHLVRPVQETTHLPIVSKSVDTGLFASDSLEFQLAELIDRSLNKTYSGRNERLFHLCMRFKNNDISFNTAVDYCTRFVQIDFKQNEILSTVQSAYKIAKVQYTLNQAFLNFQKRSQ